MTSTDDDLDEEQRKQEVQYEFPYHYIPTLKDGQFSQTRHWSWGYRYLGGFRVVLDRLTDLEFDSLVDIGCGDGRFLRELDSEYPDVETFGVDYSERAIDFARAMNPELTYECRDIVEDGLERTYDVATLIEVLEHIPPQELPEFVEATVDVVADDGTVVLTVPHENKVPRDKHYQHFDREQLTDILSDHFERLEFVHFDNVRSKPLTALQRLLGGRGAHYLITNSTIQSLFWRLYTTRYLYTSEERCGRIAAVCHK